MATVGSTNAVEEADPDGEVDPALDSKAVQQVGTDSDGGTPANDGAATIARSPVSRIQRSLGGDRRLDAPLPDRIRPTFHSDLAKVPVHTGGARRARRTVIRRRFQPSVALSKAHLRAKDAWDNFVGAAIPAGTGLFVDDDPAQRVVQQRKVMKDVTWVPAVNVDPAHPTAATGTQVGYIRSSRAAQLGVMEKSTRRKVREILRSAEARLPGDAIKDQLSKAKHVDFLMNKAIRLDEWNPASAAKGATFGAGIETLEAKYDRIRQGAEHVADTLAHWRTWLNPKFPTLVDIVDVSLVESDLHEHGLGVMMVKFRKPLGGARMFAGQTVVEAVIKPEDKSLEKALLGSQSTSAANRANDLAGLKGKQRIGTLKMEVANIAQNGQPVWSTLVERIKGKSSETMVKEGTTTKSQGTLGVIPAFHETLVFAWLAGIDDLHWENVMWVKDVPYLIDADSVLMHEQMEKTGTGDQNQSGFSTVNKQESDNSREGIKKMDPVQAKSKLLDQMKKSTVTRDAILLAIKQAIAGQKGRTVPIYTQYWANIRDSYQSGDAAHRANLLNDYCRRRFLVGDKPNPRKNMGEGPGLMGTTGVNPIVDFYDEAAVKAQLKKDMDASVIPFFEFHYDTGNVTYNGVKIFSGLTIDQSFNALTAKFA